MSAGNRKRRPYRPRPRKRRTAFGIAVEAGHELEELGHTAVAIVHSLERIEGKLIRGVEICLQGAPGGTGIVTRGPQTSNVEPAHVRWFDWLRSVEQELDRMLKDAP